MNAGVREPRALAFTVHRLAFGGVWRLARQPALGAGRVRRGVGADGSWGETDWEALAAIETING